MAQRHDDPKAKATSEQSSESATRPGQTADGYLTHVKDVLTQPDAVFNAGHRSGQTNALIDLLGFLAVFFVASVVGRTFGYAGFDFEFGHIIDGVKAVLMIGIPIAALLFALNWQGGRSGGQVSLDFYMEKFGAALVLPCLLLILAIGLDILDVRIQGWFRGMALVFVYIAVFATTYTYAAPGRLKTAAAFTISFYIAYRLLALML